MTILKDDIEITDYRRPVDYRDPDLLEYYFLKIKEVRKYETQEQFTRPITMDSQLTIEFASPVS